MQTYFLPFKKHTNNLGSKKVILINKMIRDKSRCGHCMTGKLRFLRQMFHNKKWFE